MHRIFVCLSPWTSEYSQDLMQKKYAKVSMSATAKSKSEEEDIVDLTTRCNSLQTDTGKAFCWISPGSEFLIPLNCLDKAGCTQSDTGTYVGLYHTFDLKISPNFDMAS